MFDFTSTYDIIELNNERYDITNVKLTKTCVDGDGKVLGTAIPKTLTFDIPDTTAAIEGATFVYIAATVDAEGNGEETIIGTFVPVYVTVKDGYISVTAYDMLFKAQIPYSSTLDYSGAVTMADVLDDACTQSGLTLATDFTLVNGAFTVSANPFLVGQTCTEVIAAVAEANGLIAMIVNDELTFKALDITATATAEIIPGLYDTITTQDAYPAVTKITMQDTLKGETTSAGVEGCELIIKDNPFGVDGTARATLTTNILTVVGGLTYYVYNAKGCADPRLEIGDRVRIIDADETEHETFALSMTYISTAEVTKRGYASASAIPQSAVAYVPRTTSTERYAKKAYNTALNAQTSANGKNTVYYEDTEPTGGTYSDGDVWFDTNDGNRIYIYDTSAWVAKQFGTNAFAANSITAASGIIASLDAAKITTGEMSASRIKGDSLTLGGDANENGYVTIKNASGVNAAFLDNTGYGLWDSTGTLITTIASTTANATLTVGSGKTYTTVQSAIDSLPMMVNHTITISVDAGTYAETVTISGKIGSGTIKIQPASGTVNISRLVIYNCKCEVYITGAINITDTLNTRAVDIYDCDHVTLYSGITITGSATTKTGIVVRRSNVGLDTITISNRIIAVSGSYGANITTKNVGGSNNSTCFSMNDGAVMSESVSSPNTITNASGSVEYVAQTQSAIRHGTLIINGTIAATARTRPTAALTSNALPVPYAALASSRLSTTYDYFHAFDLASNATSWVSAAADASPYVYLKMDIPLYDIVVTLTNRVSGSSVNGPISGNIQGSNDGVNWTQLASFSGRDGATSGASSYHPCNNYTQAYLFVLIWPSTWVQSGATYVALRATFDGKGVLTI